MSSLSRVWLFATPWTVAHQAPPSMGFSRQEYCSGMPFSSPGEIPDPGIKPGSPALQASALPSEPPGEHIVYSYRNSIWCCCFCLVASVMSDSVWPHRQQPTRLPRLQDSPGKNTGVGCHFLLQCMKVKSEREVAQSCPTLSDPMDWSLPGSSVHGIFQARVLEWGAIAFSEK